ncbi:MAG TPA: sigma-70 family RNA polymerase sigma factor, partial [Blastocatellia bacterium]|nr:sigma-70 family RNA polymerase sigma factor [Blastocatellia bacterium]
MKSAVELMNQESVRSNEFEKAALPHLDDLYRAASRIIGNRTQAEDLVQETYLQAWKSFDRFEPGTNCRAWLFKILFHVIQHHRRKSFRLKLTDEGDEIFAQTLIYEPPVPQDLTNEDVLAAFQKLPEQYREVVLLSDVYDFKYKEIQATLGIPQGTVMSRLSRGRELLRKHLAAFAEASGAPVINQYSESRTSAGNIP